MAFLWVDAELTEGRGTGIPKIQRVLKANGSPEPLFILKAERTFFYIEIKIHPEFLQTLNAKNKAQVEAQVKLSETEIKILAVCQSRLIGNKKILDLLGYKSLTGNVKRALSHLQRLNLIAYTIPDKPRSKNQCYKVTERGEKYLIK